MEVLSDSLRRMHFSDEESDRLIDLEEREVLALTRHLQPALRNLMDDAIEAARQDGYEDGRNDAYDRYVRGEGL
jgi:hypothetical protein